MWLSCYYYLRIRMLSLYSRLNFSLALKIIIHNCSKLVQEQQLVEPFPKYGEESDDNVLCNLRGCSEICTGRILTARPSPAQPVVLKACYETKPLLTYLLTYDPRARIELEPGCFRPVAYPTKAVFERFLEIFNTMLNFIEQCLFIEFVRYS